MRWTRWSGVAAVAVLWFGVGAAVVGTGFPLFGSLPLSRLADGGLAGTLFGCSLGVAAVLFVVFCRHLVAHQPVGRGFAPSMVTAMAGQLVVAIVPIGPVGDSNPVHVVAGLVLGALIPVFLWRFAAGQGPGPWRRTCFGLLGAQASATVIGLVLSRRGVAALAEVLPAVAFHVWVLVVTVHDASPSPFAPGTRAPVFRGPLSQEP